jgi:hypothetical protein
MDAERFKIHTLLGIKKQITHVLIINTLITSGRLFVLAKEALSRQSGSKALISTFQIKKEPSCLK